MIFKTHTLSSPINQYVESVFYFKDFIPDHSIERVVPTGHLFIIFELDDIPRSTYDNDTLEPTRTFKKAWISGMHKHYISISAHKNSEMLIIQFKPFGAFPFLHLPIEELNEKIIPAEDVLEGELLELRDNIINQQTISRKFNIAEEWLTSRFNSDKTPPQKLLDILKQLQTEPAAKLNGLSEHYPYTQKHLIEQFKKYIGLTPKYYHRIARFNEILQQIQQKEHIAWSQIAYQSGYSDQSHFIKEFRHFSGFNPEEYIEQDFHKDMPNFFPLDRKG